jgi:hypothetical protein
VQKAKVRFFFTITFMISTMTPRRVHNLLSKFTCYLFTYPFVFQKTHIFPLTRESSVLTRTKCLNIYVYFDYRRIGISENRKLFFFFNMFKIIIRYNSYFTFSLKNVWISRRKLLKFFATVLCKFDDDETHFIFK